MNHRVSEEDLEFMDELEAAQVRQSRVSANILLWSIVGLIVLFVLWATLSEIDELTRGQGQVVPSQEIQVVQSLEGGILAELLVAEGDLVKEGQVLMRISDVQFAAEERGAEARAASFTAKKLRLEAEAAGTDLILPPEIEESYASIAANEMALYRSRQAELANALSILKDKKAAAEAELAETKAQISRLSNSRALLSEELDMTNRMVQARAVPEIEAVRLRRELSDVTGQLSAQREKRSGVEAELRATEKQLADQEDKFRSQALTELSGVETELAQLEEMLKSAEDRVFRTELRAPVDGIVNNIALKTIGGVIQPAQQLIEIVPVDDELKIIAKVAPQDIAFLKVGQPVKVKVTAYDPQRYGALDGKLTRIGANSVNDREGNIFFEIEVRTAQNYLGTESNPLPITPGMVAMTEVVTGRRTIMEYLMRPVLRMKDRAFRER